LWCCSTRSCALVNIHFGAGNITLTGLLPNLQGVSLCEVPATAARLGTKKTGGICTESKASPHVGMKPFRRPAPVHQLSWFKSRSEMPQPSPAICKANKPSTTAEGTWIVRS
jgi:hypothetical protein